MVMNASTTATFVGDLVPNLVDARARLTPDALYSEYPVSTLTYQEGYHKITYRDLANAVNGAARWLIDTLGPGEDFETLAYIGPNDIRYPALILGAVKAGYKLFLTSPRNSVAAHSNLFDRLKSKVLLSSTPRLPAVTSIDSHGGLRIVDVPDVTYLLDIHHHHVSFDKSWPKHESEPLFVIHTSGSTGMPKPLLYTHATAAANIKMMSLDPPHGYSSQDRLYQGKRVFIAFPPFHGAYLVSHLFNAVSFGTIMIAPVSGSILSGEGLIQSLKTTPADIAFLVPSIVQDLAKNPDSLEYCANNLDAILYCGGDLPKTIGDTVASRIGLFNQFGASELGLTPQLLSSSHRDPMDWKYAQFHPDLGLELRQSSDDIFELCAVRNPTKLDLQPTFTIFPEVEEYASRDLFKRHPSNTKHDLWSWQSRADDIIVFLNGEKTNPISMEQYIMSHHHEVSAALVVGAQRFQAALLIEPIAELGALQPSERAAYIERIWPVVEEANRDAPSHARIMKSHILLTQPAKSMMRAGKGTIQRPGTLSLYASETDALYKDADAMSTDQDPNRSEPVSTLTKSEVKAYVRETVLTIMELPQVDEEADLFGLGLDSLHTIVLVRNLRRRLIIPTIAPSTVYTNPSVSSLSHAIVRLLDRQDASEASLKQARVDDRNALIKEYKIKIEEQLTRQSEPASGAGQDTVILTGSTGNFGPYILHVLLRSPAIAHIYCLNRSKGSLVMQAKKHQSLGLASLSNGARVSFLTVDFNKPLFNLDHAHYKELYSKTTIIIHNAWTVNFNMPLSSFRSQLDGLYNLLVFVGNCSHSAKMLYVSSISSAMSFCSPDGTTPEQPIVSDSAPGPNGYAESKYVAEQIMALAASKLMPRHSLAFARVGQIAGPAKLDGMWNPAEWFPSLIRNWVPIDLLAQILVELALAKGHSAESVRNQISVYHPLNPCVTTWTALRDSILGELSARAGRPIEVVSLRSWVAQVRKEVETIINSGDKHDVDVDATLDRVPAARLLGFFEDLSKSENTTPNRLEISRTLELSRTMRNLAPINGDLVCKWI